MKLDDVKSSKNVEDKRRYGRSIFSGVRAMKNRVVHENAKAIMKEGERRREKFKAEVDAMEERQRKREGSDKAHDMDQDRSHHRATKYRKLPAPGSIFKEVLKRMQKREFEENNHR